MGKLQEFLMEQDIGTTQTEVQIAPFPFPFIVKSITEAENKAIRKSCQKTDFDTFEMKEGDKEDQGTVITLYLNEESYEFSNEYRAREVLDKYCSFMPIPIFLDNAKAEPEYETVDKEELTEKDTIVETVVEPAKTEEKENENGEKETVEIEPSKERYKIIKRPVALNDTTPLWNKHPNECTEDEYRTFYRKVFMDYKEPLFCGSTHPSFLPESN